MNVTVVQYHIYKGHFLFLLGQSTVLCLFSYFLIFSISYNPSMDSLELVGVWSTICSHRCNVYLLYSSNSDVWPSAQSDATTPSSHDHLKHTSKICMNIHNYIRHKHYSYNSLAECVRSKIQNFLWYSKLQNQHFFLMFLSFMWSYDCKRNRIYFLKIWNDPIPYYNYTGYNCHVQCCKLVDINSWVISCVGVGYLICWLEYTWWEKHEWA